MKKNYRKIISYLFLIIVFGGIIFAFTIFFDSPSITANVVEEEKMNFKPVISGSTEPGEVSIELTPHKIQNGQMIVDIAVNTHSVDLSQFDLEKITTLEYNGKVIKPVSALSLTGHHSYGTLIFDVEEEITNFVIKIKGIPNIAERIFSWR